MSSDEKWRLIPSVPGLLASSQGRLMVVPHTDRPRQGRKQYGGTPTPGQWEGDRYVYVFRGKCFKVARLICEAFSGPPKEGQVCMHLDENSRNNKPENLAWGTQRENLNAPGFIEYCKSRTGDRSPTAKARKRSAEHV